MTRLILIAIVAFLLPASLWAAHRAWRQRRRARFGDPQPAPESKPVPWDWLVVWGAALALVVVGAFLLADLDSRADCDWVPSRIVDGRLQPAHCR